MVYRQGITNRRVSVNPAKEVEMRIENNSRDRYLLAHEEAALAAPSWKTILSTLPK
jgi:hypothetical protein